MPHSRKAVSSSRASAGIRSVGSNIAGARFGSSKTKKDGSGSRKDNTIANGNGKEAQSSLDRYARRFDEDDNSSFGGSSAGSSGGGGGGGSIGSSNGGGNIGAAAAGPGFRV